MDIRQLLLRRSGTSAELSFDPQIDRSLVTQIREWISKSDPDLVVQTLVQLADDADAGVRGLAINELLLCEKCRESNRVVEMCIEHLADSDHTVRGIVLYRLLHDVDLDQKIVAPVSIVLRNDPDPAIRCLAAQVLGKAHDPAALPFLYDAYAADYGEDVEGKTVSALAEASIQTILGNSLYQ